MTYPGDNIVAVLHSHENDCHEFAHHLKYNLSMCLKNYTSVPYLIESNPQMKVQLAKIDIFIVQLAVILISRQLLTDKSQIFEDFVETQILRKNTPQYIIWLDDNEDDFRELGTLVSNQYPTLEAPARRVQLCSNEEAEAIAQDITTVLCKYTGELRMTCYKSLENTKQFLSDNMDLHHVLKRLEQDNQLSPDHVKFFKVPEQPKQVRGILINCLKDSMRQDLYNLLGCILKEAGQDFLAEEIEDCERKQEEAIRGVIQPVQAVKQAGQIGTELPGKHPGKHELEVPTAAMQKVVLLGDTGAGKSNLVLSITNGEAQVEPKAERTIGVNLTSYHDTKHGVMYELYDFGGDEIYHITHQFLFTPQTLYLLNVDLHGYNSEKFQKSLGTWLTSVTSRVVNPAITVVGTKTDLLQTHEMKESLCHQIKKDIEAMENAVLDNLAKEIQSCEDALKALESDHVSEHFDGLTKEDIIAKKMSIEKLIEGRSQYLVDVQVLPVSSKTFEGMEDLCTKMAEMTFNIQAVEQKFRLSGMSFKEEIRRSTDNLEPYLHLNECQKIGAAAGMKESDVLNALSYLHMTGQILFYNHIRGMEDVIFPYPAIVLGLFKQIFENDKTEYLHKYSLGMTERKANSLLKVLLEDKTATFNKLLPLLKHFGLYHSGLFTPVLPTAKPEEKQQSVPDKLQPGYGSISIYMEHFLDPPVGFLEAIVSRLLSIPQTKYKLVTKDAGCLSHSQTVAYITETLQLMQYKGHKFQGRIEHRIEQGEISYLRTPKVDRIQVCGKLVSVFGLVKEIGEAMMQVGQDMFPMLYTKGSIKCEGATNSLALEAARRHRAADLMKLSQGQSLEDTEHNIHRHYLDNQLYKMSRDLEKVWKSLGHQLKLEQETLDSIAEDYRSSEQCTYTQQAFQVLKLWYTKNNKGPLQFLPKLEEALNAMGKTSQADVIYDLIEKYEKETVVDPNKTAGMQWSVHLTGNEGTYLCKRTNLGVVTPCTLHVSYWCENWSAHAHDWEKKDEEKWRPVGPMFSIKCEEVGGPVDILLPHVLHLSKNEASAINTDDVKVVHIVEGTAELLSSTEVTTTHVITRFKKGSVFGPMMRRSGLDYPSNGLCVVFAPVKLTPEFQLRVYMVSNAVEIVEDLQTIEEKEGYKKRDQEPCVLQTGKNYTVDVTVQEEKGNVPIAYPEQGLTFHDTLEKGIYYKKFRVQVKVSRPKVTLEIHLKDADNATVCIFPTEALNIAQDEEKADNSHIGLSENDVTNVHPQIMPHVPPNQTLSSGKGPILLVSDEYCTSKGGISTINLNVARKLTAAGAEVYATVLEASEEDERDAKEDGVTLLKPHLDPSSSTKPSLEWLTVYHSVHFPHLPPNVSCIVGHVHVTSTAAAKIKEERFPHAKLAMFGHVMPEETEPLKSDEKALGVGMKEASIQDDLGKADVVFSVGARIHRHYARFLRLRHVDHHIFLPEPSKVFSDANVIFGEEGDVRKPERVILSIGRVRNVERLKGHDLAAGAIDKVAQRLDHLCTLRLRVRGIDENGFKESKRILDEKLRSGRVKPTLLPYGTQEEIRRDMENCHLVLMPSRAEPFGLVGLEAIVAGVPVLISEHSGLAELIEELSVKLGQSSFRHCIVKMTGDTATDADAEKWAERIEDFIKNARSEFAEARAFKQKLLASKYWEESHRTFLQACVITDARSAQAEGGDAEIDDAD